MKLQANAWEKNPLKLSWIQTLNQIIPKIWSIVSGSISELSWKSNQNLSTAFGVMQLTDKQTNVSITTDKGDIWSRPPNSTNHSFTHSSAVNVAIRRFRRSIRQAAAVFTCFIPLLQQHFHYLHIKYFSRIHIFYLRHAGGLSDESQKLLRGRDASEVHHHRPDPVSIATRSPLRCDAAQQLWGVQVQAREGKIIKTRNGRIT